MDQVTNNAPLQPARLNLRPWLKFFILLVVIGSVATLISLLPRGYSQDISLIGKGENAVVLVHDHNKLASLETMNALNTLRGEYEGHVKFLVADIFTRKGKGFAEKYDTPFTALVFFAPNGERLKTLYGQQDAATIRETLNQQFRN